MSRITSVLILISLALSIILPAHAATQPPATPVERYPPSVKPSGTPVRSPPSSPSSPIIPPRVSSQSIPRSNTTAPAKRLSVLGAPLSSEDAPLPTSNPDWSPTFDFNQVPYSNLPVLLPNATCPINFDCTRPGACSQCFQRCGTCPTPQDVYGCNSPRDWALTFQESPSAYTGKLLDVLKAADVKATFFVRGSRLAKYGQYIRRAYAEGHQIASAGWSGVNLALLTNKQIMTEFRTTEDALLDLIGVFPVFVQAPFGLADNRVNSILAAMGYQITFWNVESGDVALLRSHENPAESTEIMLDAIGTRRPLDHGSVPAKGYISRQSDDLPATVTIQRQIIDALRRRNLRLTTLYTCAARNETSMYLASDGSSVYENAKSLDAGEAAEDQENEDKEAASVTAISPEDATGGSSDLGTLGMNLNLNGTAIGNTGSSVNETQPANTTSGAGVPLSNDRASWVLLAMTVALPMSILG